MLNFIISLCIAPAVFSAIQLQNALPQPHMAGAVVPALTGKAGVKNLGSCDGYTIDQLEKNLKKYPPVHLDLENYACHHVEEEIVDGKEGTSEKKPGYFPPAVKIKSMRRIQTRGGRILRWWRQRQRRNGWGLIGWWRRKMPQRKRHA